MLWIRLSNVDMNLLVCSHQLGIYKHARPVDNKTNTWVAGFTTKQTSQLSLAYLSPH